VNATVNGEPRELPPGATVASVLELLDVGWAAPDFRGVAVAVDGEVVPRSCWAATTLDEGTAIEVVAAIGGG
jgi:sulfur carrier protein